MPHQSRIQHASGASEEQRAFIRNWLNTRALKTLMRDTCLPGEAVVQEIRYWHQSASNPYSTHQTKTAKKRSYAHWGGACQKKGCTRPLTLVEAVFHHRRRGIPNQHAPENVLPYHHECHDAHHGARRGSLVKGAPARKARSGSARTARRG